jgi:hypothetical protein
MGSSNLQQITKQGINQCGFASMTRMMCIKGNVHDSMKGKLQVPHVWLVFISTRLTHMEVASFKEVWFRLPRHAHAT